MTLPLGSPIPQTPLTITNTAQQITIPHGIISLELQNTGNVDIYFGDSTVDSTKGGVIYSNGDRKVFETIPSNFTIYVITASATSTLRIIHYK